MHIIQKEKEDALQDYREEILRSHLDRKFSQEGRSSRSFIQWFRKPAVAGSSVLLVILLAWLSKQLILPTYQYLDEMYLKNMFVQVFSKNETILNHRPAADETDSEKSAIYEFEWSLKRVILAIQRENSQDEDITQDLSMVLHKASILSRSDKYNSKEFKI